MINSETGKVVECNSDLNEQLKDWASLGGLGKLCNFQDNYLSFFGLPHKLNQILIVNLENQKSFVIPVTCKYESITFLGPYIIGLPLETDQTLGKIHRWDKATGELLPDLDMQSERHIANVIHHETQLFLVSGDGIIKAYDAQKDCWIYEKQPIDRPPGIADSWFEEEMLMTSSREAIRLFYIKTGELLHSFEPPEYSTFFLENKFFCIFGKSSKILQIWEFQKTKVHLHLLNKTSLSTAYPKMHRLKFLRIIENHLFIAIEEEKEGHPITRIAIIPTHSGEIHKTQIAIESSIADLEAVGAGTFENLNFVGHSLVIKHYDKNDNPITEIFHFGESFTIPF